MTNPLSERLRKNQQSNFWTDERVKQFKAILARKPIPSTRDIAIEMGAASRNVIIGKARREGLDLNPQCYDPNKRARTRKRKANPNPKLYVPRPVITLPDFLGTKRREKASATTLANIADREAEDAAAAQNGGIGFFEIRDGKCRWPLTDVQPISDFRFCGVVCKGTYCGHHARRSINRYFAAEAAE